MSCGVNVTGRLGNAMFEIATGEYWRSLGFDVTYNDIDTWLLWLKRTFNNTAHVHEYKAIFKNFNWEAHPHKEPLIQKKVPFRYTSVTPENGIEYVGYFQSEKNFPDKDLVKHLFEPSEAIEDFLISKDNLYEGITCSIHVRRDDFLTSQGQHPVCTMEYYDDAVYTLDKFKIDRYLVFSDDLPWCREHFKGRECVFVDEKDYLCLFMMTQCDHHICANSTFSWWGAWLGETLDTVTITPAQWLGIDKPKDFADDLIPQRWIKL